MRRILGALVVAVLTLTAVPAHAQPWRTNDPKADQVPDPVAEWGDIRKVEARHADHRLHVKVTFNDKGWDDLWIWINSRPGRPGPDLIFKETPYTKPYLVRKGPKGRHPLVKCPRLKAPNLRTQRVYRLSIPRRCVKRATGKMPNQLRIRVQSADDNWWSRDYAPQGKKYSPWMRAG